MSFTRTVQLFRGEKSLNQLVFEAISFRIIDQAGFSASLDIGKGFLHRGRVHPLALSFLPHLLSNPRNASDWGEWPCKKASDQAHTGSPASSPSMNE
jgi:hypothetical protein